MQCYVSGRYREVISLKGRNILITSGPTRGYIDAVRYISNKSTGKLGASVAMEALKRGVSVTFIYGTESVIPDITQLGKDYASQLTLIEIETFDDVLTTIQEKLKDIDWMNKNLLIMTSGNFSGVNLPELAKKIAP